MHNIDQIKTFPTYSPVQTESNPSAPVSASWDCSDQAGPELLQLRIKYPSLEVNLDRYLAGQSRCQAQMNGGIVKLQGFRIDNGFKLSCLLVYSNTGVI